MAIDVPNDKRHDRIMHLLARQAQDNAPNGTSKHAAAVVFKNEIISIGWNEFKSHPFQVQFRKEPEKSYLHAEVSAIRKSLNHITPDQLKKSTLYVARVMKNNEWGISCPCDGCKMAIAAFDIKKVIYTAGSSDYKAL
jgi:tRNA(Arg) A34 adenosine deaminase TadA